MVTSNAELIAAKGSLSAWLASCRTGFINSAVQTGGGKVVNSTVKTTVPGIVAVSVGGDPLHPDYAPVVSVAAVTPTNTDITPAAAVTPAEISITSAGVVTPDGILTSLSAIPAGIEGFLTDNAKNIVLAVIAGLIVAIILPALLGSETHGVRFKRSKS
jgi:hypothetical protein